MAGNSNNVQMTLDQVRQNLFVSSYPEAQEVAPQNFSAGAVNTINLPHAGIGLWVRLTFRGTVSRTEGASVGTVTASPLAPWNMLSNITFKDYTGITRVNVSGYMLHQREIETTSMGNAYDPTIDDVMSNPYASDLYAFSIPTGTANTTTTSTLNFSIEMPISLAKDTTVGSYPFTVPTGDSTVYATMNTAQGATVDFPFTTTGGTTMSFSGTLYATYYYLEPPAGIQLPTPDFSVIHELSEVRQTDNLAANGQKRFTLNTGRTYYALYQLLMSNNAPDTLDVSKLTMLLNGSTPTMDEYRWSYLERIRQTYGRSFDPGVFIWNFRKRPWTPDSYGSLQPSLTLGSAFNNSGNTYLLTLQESLYVAAVGR